MTTLLDFLEEYPDVEHVQVALPKGAGIVTNHYVSVSVGKKFRTKMALLEAFEQYMTVCMEDRMTTDDRIQDMIDHSLGELKFTVEVT